MLHGYNYGWDYFSTNKWLYKILFLLIKNQPVTNG
jgi:hypothetical protein